MTRHAGISPPLSNPRLSTPKLRQIIQFESSELSAREVGRALSLSHGAISKYRCAVRAAGVSWDEAQRLDDAELERRIWQARAERKRRQVVLPDCASIHTELKRHKHVTLQLLWDEYHATHGTLALRYSSYCERYRHWVVRYNARCVNVTLPARSCLSITQTPRCRFTARRARRHTAPRSLWVRWGRVATRMRKRRARRLYRTGSVATCGC